MDLSPPVLPAAVVLDFDGVIADSEPLHLEAFQRVLGEVGIDLSPQAYYDRYLGFTDLEVFEAVAADHDVRLEHGQVQRLFERKASVLEALLGDPRVLFPGAAERVREYAAAVPLAIASGARREEIDLVLRAAGLGGCFSVIVAAGETARAKPAPDPYARAIELLAAAGRLGPGVPPSACVAIEDSRWGISSAKAAGLRCIGVTTSYAAEALVNADAVAPSLAGVSLALLAAVVSDGAVP